MVVVFILSILILLIKALFNIALAVFCFRGSGYAELLLNDVTFYFMSLSSSCACKVLTVEVFSLILSEIMNPY